jgi:AcrR family transcriptional regulator
VNEILRIAAAMFAEVGYEKTSFTSIADAVGIQRASLYHYYANKDALLLDIGLPWLNPLAALVEEFEEEIAPGEVKLYRYLRIDLRHIRAAPYDLGRLYHLPDISAGESMAPLWRIVDTIHDAWTRWITAAVADGALRRVDPRLAGSLVEAAYLGVITSDRPAVREDVGNTADDFADLILAGLLADPERLAELRRLALELDGADPILQTEGNRPLPMSSRAR